MRFLFLLLALPACVQAQSVTLPQSISGLPGQWILVSPLKVDGGTPNWRHSSGLQEVNLSALLPPELTGKLRGKVLTASTPGTYTVEAWNAKGDKASDIATCVIEIKDPTPTPTPIPTAGLRVLIVKESSQKQSGLSKEVADYLNAKCVKVNNQPEWRWYDPNQNMANESKIWQDAMSRKRDSLPWVLISDGTKGFEGPWPDSKEAQLELLRKYGG